MSRAEEDPHFPVWKSRISIARMAYSEGKLHEAEGAIRKAMSDANKISDKEYPLAVTLNYQALVCIAAGRLHEAEELLVKARRAAESASSPEYQQTLGSTLRNLGNLKAQQEKHQEAESLYKEALEMMSKCLAESSREVAHCLSDLASLYLIQKRYDEAAPLVSEAMTMLEALGSNPASVERAKFIYEACSSYGDEEELAQLFEAAASKMEYNLGSKNPNLVRALKLYAKHLVETGNTEQLAKVEQRFKSLQPT